MVIIFKKIFIICIFTLFILNFTHANGQNSETPKSVKLGLIKEVHSTITNETIDKSFRALGGSSLGGLFVLYAMFTRPDLFHAYIALSPATLWDDDWLFKLEEEFYNKNPALPVSLYMTGAEKESPDFLNGVRRFNEVLEKRNYSNFRYYFRVLDDAYHAGSKPEGYTRGIQFIFKPLLKK